MKVHVQSGDAEEESVLVVCVYDVCVLCMCVCVIHGQACILPVVTY